MNNVQWSKCPKCKQDEKYVVWISIDGDMKEERCCAKQCMIDKKNKKDK